MPEVALKGAYLSFQQERLWSFQQGQETYRALCTVVLNGRLDFQAFKQALQQVVEQHTIFRTLFYVLPGMDVPIQAPGHSVELNCPIIDLEGIVVAEQRALLETLLNASQEETFDLEHGPLFRPACFRLSVHTSLLRISIPALYADAATLPLLIEDIAQRYTANLAGQQLVEDPLQYSAVSAWQRQLVTEESGEAKVAHDFWKKIDLTRITQMQRSLAKIGIVENSDLKYSRDTTFAPRTLPLLVDDGLSARINALALHYDVSLAAVLLACWSVVLWRLTDEPQLVIGVACDGRNYEELTDAPGLYTCFVPFANSLEDSWSFLHVLNVIELLLQSMKRYQTYFSWPEMLDETHSSTDPAFFPILFEQERWPASFESAALSLGFERRFCCTEPFVLKLGVLQVGERLLLELHYDAHKVSCERAKNLAAMFHMLLEDMIERPQVQIGVPSLLSVEEREQLLSRGRGPQKHWQPQSIPQLFEEQVRRHPQALAVLSRQQQWSYQQVNTQANHLAQALRRRGVGAGSVVGLCLAREARMLVGLLGILKSGAAYLPLEAGMPAERWRSQLQQSAAQWLLTQASLHQGLAAWEGQTLVLEELAQEPGQVGEPAQQAAVEPAGLAYVIYTSGSTGQPKGVMVSHRNVVNYARAIAQRLGAQAGWQYAMVSTLAADLGNTAIFAAWASAGCVQILEYEQVTSAQAMGDWASSQGMDVLKIVPSHLWALLESEQAPALLPQRALVLGGEALPVGMLQRLAALGASCEVYNHYGPTETTVGVLLNGLGRQEGASEGRQTGEGVGLGSALANTQVYVLDERMQVVPQGVRGELYIGGAGVSWGYVGQGGQTAERYVPDAYGEQEGGRLYRTGDLVRWGRAGQLVFEGRADRQVKLRGYRIEAGEIEVVLREHPQVRDCAVVLREDVPGGYLLVAYVVPRNVPLRADINLRGFLQQRLPDYMVPATFIYVKFLPLTANGKVDRRQLIAGESDHALSLVYIDGTAKKLVQPRDEIELRLSRIWEEILQVRSVSVLDNFFDIGGHSLLAVRLISRIAESFGQNLDLAALFQYPTVAELAVVLRQQSGAEEGTPVVAIQPQGSRPAFFCVHPAGGTAFCYVNLARHLGPDQPFYGLHAPLGNSAVGRSWKTVEEMASHYVASIRFVQPQGPYLIGGWSLGGVVAFEMAQQLRRQGHEVGVLAIIDSHLSNPQTRAKVMAEGVDLSDAAVVRDFIRTFEIVVPDNFSQRTVEEQFRSAVELAKKMRVIPVDISIEYVWRFSCTKIANKHIKRLYVPDMYEQKIDYFLPDDSIEHTEDAEEGEDMTEAMMVQNSLQRWRELAKGGFAIHHVPGNHSEMVEEPNVQILAHALKQCISKSCGYPE